MHHDWKQWSFLLMWSQFIFWNGPFFRFRWNANLQILLEDIQPASPKLKTYSSSHNNGSGKWVPTRLISIAMVMGECVPGNAWNQSKKQVANLHSSLGKFVTKTFGAVGLSPGLYLCCRVPPKYWLIIWLYKPLRHVGAMNAHRLVKEIPKF